METPTAADVRAAYPKFDWPGRGYAVPSSGDDPLQPLVDEAVSYVSNITWRALDSTMPPVLAPTALRAVALRTAQTLLQGDDEYAATVNDDAIASFSIGPYSETRRDTSTLRGGRSPATERLNAWPALEQLLWILLSLVYGESNRKVDERRNYWRGLLQNINPPAFGLQEVDWTNGLTGRGLYGGWGLPGPTVDVADPVV